jgi:hypothetical protein
MSQVSVMVWLPRPEYISAELRSNGKSPFGHVSLRTYDENGLLVEYISFWPMEPVAGIHNPRKKGVCHELEFDKRNLPRENYKFKEIKLKSLNTEKINEGILRFKTSGCDWSIFGSADIMAKVETQNCSSLVLYLLIIGGIQKISNVEDLLVSAVKDGAYWGGIVSLFYSIPGAYFIVGMAARAAVRLNPRVISIGNIIGPGLAGINNAIGLNGAAVDPNLFSRLFGVGTFSRIAHGISSKITPVGLAGSAFLTAVGAGVAFFSATSAGRARIIPSPTDLTRFLENAEKKEQESLVHLNI